MTSIEWVKNADGSQGLTWNPIRGCTRVSPGCGGPGPHGGCYAEGIAARFSGPGQPYEGLAVMKGGKPRWTGKLVFVESALLLPLRRKKPTTWFVNSMSDLFHESVPDEWIDRVFAVMALAPQHTFQVLTKRSARMRAYCTSRSQLCGNIGGSAADIMLEHTSTMLGGVKTTHPLEAAEARKPAVDWAYAKFPNVWLGVSAEDQRRADERVPDLLATPAAVRFVSAEPLLGPIDFRRLSISHPTYDAVPATFDALIGQAFDLGDTPIDGLMGSKLDWIIAGGESGPNARPMHPAWARSIRDQCAAAGVAYLFKQWGAWVRAPAVAGLEAGAPVFWPDGTHGYGNADRNGGPGVTMVRVGKKAAGRLLDGVEHNGMPEVRPFPKPRRKDGEPPCGECHLQPGETCDICGAVAPPASSGQGGR